MSTLIAEMIETQPWSVPVKHKNPVYHATPSIPPAGKIKITWKKKDSTNAIGSCVCCVKAIKKKQIYTELNIVKKDPYSSNVLELNFYLHKKCLMKFLMDCPYESVEVLQGIDLNELDNF